MASSQSRKRFVFLAKLAAGLLILAVLFRTVDAGEALGYIAAADPLFILVGAALTLGQTALSALKWKVLLAGRGYAVPYLLLLKSYFIGNVVNLFTPGFIAGDTYRAASIRRSVGTFSRSVPSVIADRVTGLVALVALGSVGLGIYLAGDRYGLVIAGIFAAIGFGYLVFLKLVAPFLLRLSERRESRVIAFANDLAEAFRPTRALAHAQLLAVVFQTNIILINIAYSTSLDLSATVPQLFLIVPCVYLLEMLPISVAGIGVRETAFAALFASFGLPPEQGVALGLVISGMRYVVGGVGAFAWLIPVQPTLRADGV